MRNAPRSRAISSQSGAGQDAAEYECNYVRTVDDAYVVECPWDLWKLPVDGDHRPVPLVRTQFDEGGGWFSPDGREILMRAPDATLRVVDVEPGPTFRCGRARVLFKIGDDVVGICPTPDHRRFLATINAEQAAVPAIVVDMNWLTALRTK